MTTIINNPDRSSDTGAGVVIGVVVIVLLGLFLLFGLPRLRDDGTKINVPDRINVNTDGN